jgi:hypothetical protein
MHAGNKDQLVYHKLKSCIRFSVRVVEALLIKMQ